MFSLDEFSTFFILVLENKTDDVLALKPVQYYFSQEWFWNMNVFQIAAYAFRNVLRLVYSMCFTLDIYSHWASAQSEKQCYY